MHQSQISELGNYSEEITDNKLPYFPDLSAYGKIRWYFYKEHAIQISSRYMGKRYNDLLNKHLLSDYLLFEAKVGLAFHPNISLFIRGQNLFDTKYEEWQGSKAAGITGAVGMRIKM